MSWADTSGARADVARKTKRELDPVAADLAIMRRLLAYDQMVRLKAAGYSPGKIGPALGYSREWVRRVLKDMAEARREILSDAG